MPQAPACSAESELSVQTLEPLSQPADYLALPADIDFWALRGVLFDIDGTLTNSDPLHYEAFKEILQECGFNGGQPISEGFFRSQIAGRHNPEIAADLFPEWGEERRRQFYEDKEARYRRLAASGLVPLPGLTDFLSWLESMRMRKAAVTNAPRANAEMMLQALGLEHRFEALVLGEECARAKPHPDPYLQGLQHIGLEGQPQSVLVVEDSPSGVRAGVGAGLRVIGLTTGQSATSLRAAGACWVVEDFEDIMGAVARQDVDRRRAAAHN